MKTISDSVLVIINKENGKLLAKRQGKCFETDEFPEYVLTYRYDANAKRIMKDRAYWEYRGIDISRYKVARVKLILTELGRYINEPTRNL